MTDGNAKRVTDLELYNGFVWVEKDGRAASMYYGKKLLWKVETGIEEIDKWHIYAQISYAMLAATCSDDDLADMHIDRVKIAVQQDGDEKSFLIPAVNSDASHDIFKKIQTQRERI